MTLQDRRFTRSTSWVRSRRCNRRYTGVFLRRSERPSRARLEQILSARGDPVVDQVRAGSLISLRPRGTPLFHVGIPAPRLFVVEKPGTSALCRDEGVVPSATGMWSTT